MIKHKDQRVGVFIDVANMYHSAKNLYQARVKFDQVLASAIDGRKLIRAIAYVIHSASEEEANFFAALDKQGFELNQKELQIFLSGQKKADWDVGMAVDAIKMGDRLDSVILVTGDGDFVPLVTYLQESKGCLVEVIGFGETTSSRLIEAADDFLDLSANKNKYLLRRPGVKRAARTTTKRVLKPRSRRG